MSWHPASELMANNGPVLTQCVRVGRVGQQVCDPDFVHQLVGNTQGLGSTSCIPRLEEWPRKASGGCAKAQRTGNIETVANTTGGDNVQTESLKLEDTCSSGDPPVPVQFA